MSLAAESVRTGEQSVEPIAIGKLETRFLCLPDSKVLLSENDDPLKQATPIRGSRNWKLDIESVVSTSIRKQVMQE